MTARLPDRTSPIQKAGEGLAADALQTQTLGAVGRLAGGIAHDFNNLLTIILGRADEVLNGLPPSGPLAEAVQDIRRAGERASALTASLLAFSRQQVIQPCAVNLNALISELVPAMSRVLGDEIELVTTLVRAQLFVYVDPHQIEQVIMNLVANARDAMPDGGVVTITTQVDRAEGAEGAGSQHGDSRRPGAYARLTVGDTGDGMDQDTLSHLFEPFFTTKRVGEGSGLGLASVFGIVSQSGGDIRVESRLGEGTRFIVSLPMALVAHVVDARPAPPPAVTVGGGQPVVLVAEDEAEVRELTCSALGLSGFTVLAAEHGIDALNRVRKTDGPIHVLVTDVVMPHMNGVDLAKQIRQIRPDIKVVFMSGYAPDILEADDAMAGAQFLQKPFRQAALSATIRAMLDGDTA
jgi:two-component system, cell cycle sensor histidine kinase and response regulator CckA